MFGAMRVPELIIILVIALLIFGPGKLPKVGKGVGEMIRGFRQETEPDKAEQVKTEEVAPKV
ncbi:MAG TPA: twin-arginine translocase TatA/TatE family subunit [Chloroflexota bacterium]|jgi:sec-independent protein translocase protein TatA